MRKRSKFQKKMQRSTNHQTKVNVLNQIEEIENNLKISINTEKNMIETRAIAAIKRNPKYFYKFVKSNSTIRAGIGPLRDKEGNLEPRNLKMSELLNEQYNSVFSIPDPTKSIVNLRDFFGNPQANTLSDINITRVIVIDAIKSVGGSDKLSELVLEQCSKSLAHPVQLL